MNKPLGIGASPKRKEDQRLLIGKGCYSDDIVLDSQAYAYFLRSPHAHAVIKSIDTAAAKAMPGVLGVYTAADYDGAGLGELPHIPNPADLFDASKVSLHNKDGSPIFESNYTPLAREKVRHVGEDIACVVAETHDQARDAAEAIVVDYGPLPAITDVRDAIQDGAPVLWDGAPGNVVVDIEKGDAAAVDEQIAQAAHVVDVELVNPRVAQVPMEPRCSVASFDTKRNRLTLYADSQGVFVFKMCLSKIFGMPMDNIRVFSKDVGGGFGTRNFIYPEHAVIAFASRELGRPVKWTATRSDCLASDLQGRDFVTRGRLAMDAEGNFLALRVDHLYNVGASTVSFVPLSNSMRLATGCYRFKAGYLSGKGIVTNTVPTGPYRGAGRPETYFNLERLVDIAAYQSGIDRLELRRRNMITADELPYTTALGIPLDDVNFPKNMEDAVAMADLDGFEKRRDDAAKRGKLLGVGMANYFETPVGMPKEWATVIVDPAGQIQAHIGTGPTGQGHETVFSQVLVDLLGVDYDQVNMGIGDSDRIVVGGGSHSVRSMRLGGAVLTWASEEVIEKGRNMAGHLLEASANDIEFTEGHFQVTGTDKRMSLFEVAAATKNGEVPDDMGTTLDGIGSIDSRLPAYPAGCAIIEVEVDQDTGKVEIVRHSQVDDVGIVINPLLSDGQVHGGIAQGVGQAMMEGPLFDRETGQIVSGTFMDYAMPRADDFPTFVSKFNEIRSRSNPVGAKGAGESGTTPAPAALSNAIVHALSGLGVTQLEMPIKAEKVWRALNG
jgi:carbon-monoxide dehydrogenase large subunit